MQKRNLALDYTKAVLVVGMILSHSIQLVKTDQNNLTNNLLNLFSTYINLVTFSGFFFCFGFVYYLAYFKKDFTQVKGNILETGLKTLGAYYVSAFAYRLFFSDNFPVTAKGLLNILLLFDIPSLAEFLLSFFAVTIICYLFFNTIKKRLSKKWLLASAIISLLSSCLVPYDLIQNNHLGLLIGTHNFPCFPVLQYLPYFLAGIYFAQHKITFNRYALFVSLLATGAFMVYLLVNRSSPHRFPPSFFWIIGAAGIIYIYYLAALWLNKRFTPIHYLLSIGNNTLFYLLVSNLILFTTHKQVALLVNGNGIWAVLYGVTILALIHFLIKLVRPQEKIAAKPELQAIKIPAAHYEKSYP